MKLLIRRIMILLLVVAIFALTGCSFNGNREKDGLSVVSTIFASYDFARQIIGDEGEVSMLLKPGAEFHSYEPTPKDIITISECDVFIYVGGENDAWVNDILDSMDTSKMTIIKMMDLVDKYTEEYVNGMEGHEHDEDCEHDHEGWDEHVWTSPKNAVVICEAIKNALIEIHPEGKDVFTENCKKYTDELLGLHDAFLQVVADANKDTLVFGDRFPLRYFVEEYGLEYFAAFPGCSSDTEASASTVAFLIDKIKEKEIKVIFKIELSSDSMAKTIADDTGAKVAIFNTCHNVTSNQFKNGETYITLMQDNLESLKEALQ